MELTRTTALAALVLVALAAPAGAFALAGDGNPGSSHHAALVKADDDQQDDADETDGTAGTEHADAASAPGRAHAAAMKAWARCVAEAASGPKTGERTGPPKQACGEKPVGPGRAKHEAAGSTSPGKSHQPHGKSGSHGSH